MERRPGRPLTIRTPAEMEARIRDYFERCHGQLLRNPDGGYVLDKHGQAVIVGATPPTVTGLAYALGLRSRQSLLNYQGRPEYADMIRDAKMLIEAYTEARLFDRDGCKGAMFSLANNYKWTQEDGADDQHEEIMAEIRRRMSLPEEGDR